MAPNASGTAVAPTTGKKHEPPTPPPPPPPNGGSGGSGGNGGGGEPDFSNLDACIRDSYDAETINAEESSIPNDWGELLRQLNLARTSMPSEHRDGAADPFRNTLLTVGPAGFAEIWSISHQEDPARNGFLMRDIAQALLQRAPTAAEYSSDPASEPAREQARSRREATDALQEVVFDLYDNFLSPRWRQLRPNFSLLPPVVKWGNPGGMAPYTWDTSATLPFFGVECGVISMPAAYAERGLLAWASTAHECSGHDILTADAGIQSEIEDNLRRTVRGVKEIGHQQIGEYWLQRWDEAASDVMAILNMGPAAAMALLGYFKARRRARKEKPCLACVDNDPNSSHAIDIMRAALWAATIEKISEYQEVDATERLSDLRQKYEEGGQQYEEGEQRAARKADFDKSIAVVEQELTNIKVLRARHAYWVDAIREQVAGDLDEALKDPDPDRKLKYTKPASIRDRLDQAIIKLRLSRDAAPQFFTWEDAKDSAADLLDVLDKPLKCLDNAKLRDFCDWTMRDENAVAEITTFLTRDNFDQTLHELTEKRAKLSILAEYHRPAIDHNAIAYLRDELKNLWSRWHMEGLWAAHVVAAAVTIAFGSIKLKTEKVEQDKKVVEVDVDKDNRVAEGFRRMKKLLAVMHNNNQRWGQPPVRSEQLEQFTDIEISRLKAILHGAPWGGKTGG